MRSARLEPKEGIDMSDHIPPSPGTILVGVDGGAPARRALEWALRRASHSDAVVRALWVCERTDSRDENDTRDSRAHEAAIAKNLSDQLKEALAQAGLTPGTSPTVEQEVIHGNVVEELRHRSQWADLLVIGTNFHHGVAGWFKGTRALRLAADAPVPIVVVPDVELAERTGVVVGVDSAGNADRAVLWAAEEASATGQELVLLEASPLAVGAVPAYVEVATLHAEMVEGAREDAEKLALQLREDSPGLTVKCQVTSEWPVPALSRLGRHAGLVVVGSRGLGAIRRFVQGSVSSELVLSLTGPVAIVR